MKEASLRVVAIERLELRFEPQPWKWAEANRAFIERHFAKAREQRPALWNGRVLLLHRFAIEAEVFRGAYLETDFASFLAWRDAGFPDPSLKNCFSAGALRAADGAFVLGRMASHTANAGKVYFPAGTPDPGDVGADGAVDLMGSVLRELKEETGLSASEVSPAPPLARGVRGRPHRADTPASPARGVRETRRPPASFHRARKRARARGYRDRTRARRFRAGNPGFRSGLHRKRVELMSRNGL